MTPSVSIYTNNDHKQNTGSEDMRTAMSMPYNVFVCLAGSWLLVMVCSECWLMVDGWFVKRKTLVVDVILTKGYCNENISFKFKF
jgi:hypothetical protein